MSKDNGRGGANHLLPQLCRVIAVKDETPQVKTFRLQGLDGQKPFAPLPGQLGMLSLPGVGEAMFSVTAQGEDWLDMAIKKCGRLTEALHELWPGQLVGLRGPYGKPFPLAETAGQHLLFIGGGIGLAPLRAFIAQALNRRADYGHIDILYGARSYADLVFKEDLLHNWPRQANTALHITLEQGGESWRGQVGLVPPYLEQCAFTPHQRTAMVCGPPAMISLCLPALSRLGFTPPQIIVTLEMKMQCGVGTCGRCNIGSAYVCLDGPVFRLSELNQADLWSSLCHNS